MAKKMQYSANKSGSKTLTVIIVAFAAVACILFSLAVHDFVTRDSVTTTQPNVSTTSTTIPSTIPTTQPTTQPSTVPTTQPSTAPSTLPSTTEPTSADVPVVVLDWRKADPSTWTQEQMLTYLSEAVNKSKSYTGDLTVNHTENFTAEVLDCTGGSLATYVVNQVVQTMSDPSDEVFQFKNGTTVNSEGETIPILLPQAGAFTLPIEGVQSITATKDGDSVNIHLVLVPESVALNEIPVYNPQAIGFLQLTQIQNFLTLTALDIDYKGSSIDATINSDGYVSKATYTIPIHTYAGGEKGVLSGSATFEAEQVEVWELLW